MSWKQDLQNNMTSAVEVSQMLGLNEADSAQMARILAQFPMSVPRYYLSLINWDDENDPIRKMCIPSVRETDLSGSFDTSGEASNTVVVGMQHKYHATALILSTNRCAMYCRHCFRKRLVGLSDAEIASHLDEMIAYIKEHKEISNVLISGGDAFLNDNEVIEEYLSRLCEIDHLDMIRFGTRVPVSFPQRVTSDPDLIALLKKYNEKKQLFVITHFNHPNEITPESTAAVHAILSAGIPIRNQTVLLHGVNDDSEVLGTLLRRLIRIGVIPYYVFQCRPVSGVKNQFSVPFLRGIQVVEGAKRMQNGQGKSLRYALSHPTGKIEILGTVGGNRMLFKYHQAKYDKDAGRMFTMDLDENQTWLGDDIPQDSLLIP
ncbi:MAG: KamA family radical SAM protein [Butyricicoccus sp.]|nr:KamA family radical SAM protein [Clostridiales bacterium]MDY5973202.1 KamA family radical SAM protein [Butyricicoccus sp.]